MEDVLEEVVSSDDLKVFFFFFYKKQFLFIKLLAFYLYILSMWIINILYTLLNIVWYQTLYFEKKDFITFCIE